MKSVFELFPKGPADHEERWRRALELAPDICPGKDTNDQSCTCPDLVYSTKVRIRTGATFSSYIYCGCCDLPVTAPGGASAGPARAEPEAKDEVS